MNQYIVICRFNAPLEAIGQQRLDAHLALLQKWYERGCLLFYGILAASEGTLAIAKVGSRRAWGAALAVLAQDPLLTSGVARFDFQELPSVRLSPVTSAWGDGLGPNPPLVPLCRHLKTNAIATPTHAPELPMKHYIVTCHFKVPIQAIGEHMISEHLALLQKGYEQGYILMYGPMEPEDGTLAIVRVESRLAFVQAMARDPLLSSGLATCDFQEFIPVRFPKSLVGWVEPIGFHE